MRTITPSEEEAISLLERGNSADQRLAKLMKLNPGEKIRQWVEEELKAGAPTSEIVLAIVRVTVNMLGSIHAARVPPDQDEAAAGYLAEAFRVALIGHARNVRNAAAAPKKGMN